MDKARLRQAVIERINTELEVQTRAALTSRDEATHEESKPENQYDMHAQEAAYLAEGQAKLVAEQRDNIALYQSMELPVFSPTQPIALGAVVTLEINARRVHYFLGPRNGGLEVALDGTEIVVITPQSPLGRLLIGRRVGDAVNTQGAGRTITQRIVAVE
jgi:transcription elongation GreA/GreB family factor